MRHYYRAFRHRNYQLFFSGQLISVTGTWMQSVAESWLVYRLTGSAALLGVTAFCSQIPVFVLTPVAGTVADRYNRHHIMVMTQSLSMVLPLILAALTFTGVVRPWHVFLLAGCLGVVNAFDVPARQSFVVEMVGREDLLNAIALNSSMFNGARVVGPAMAGVLVAAIGEGWCFLVNGLSYIAVIAGLLLMRLPKKSGVRHHSALRDALEGFRFVGRTAPVRALLLLLGIVSLSGVPYTVLMPVFAEDILHGGARELGVLMAASGLGAVGGALTLAGRRDLRGLSRWAALGAGSFGVALNLFSVSRHLWLSVALLVPVGYALMVQFAASNTLLQAMVPDRLRGRVMSVYSMMILGMAPFGGLLAGYAAERVGAPITVAGGGVVCLVAAVLFWLHLPSVRGEARALILAQGLATASESQSVGSAAAAE